MTYRKDLDALKGIAIIAVVLFHIGLLKSGYLAWMRFSSSTDSW